MTDRPRVVEQDRPRHRPATASLPRLALAFLVLPAVLAAQERPTLGGTTPPVEAQPAAQQPGFGGGSLSLEQAIAIAGARSEQVAIARAGVGRAEGERVQARADLFPQLLGSASYDRTLATEFSGIFGSTTGPACDPFTLRPDASLEARVAEIERAIDCGAVGGSLFGGGGSGGSDRPLDLPFGRKDIWRFNLALSQNLYTGGRVPAQRALAAAGQRLAAEDLTSARAQVVLDVTQAYYDVALSERLVAIAEAGLQQATGTLEQTELAFQAGRSPEFELLRARVSRDNQRPVVVRQQAQRTLAYLRLRQLLHVPKDVPLSVEANLDSPVLPPPGPFPEPPPREAGAAPPEPIPRVAVRQAEAGVAAREAATRIARAQRLPSVSFNSAYGRVAYSGVPTFSDFRTNWTVGLFAQLPILTGGRLKGGEMVAAADLAEARAQHDRARNLAEVDTQAAYEELDAARATWEASAGTVEQAVRAFEIAELRYREGISTQLELSDARYLLEQAQANRAQAARDLQVARARIVLLPDLPLGTGTLGLAGASSLATAALGGLPSTATQPVAGRTSSPAIGAAGTSGISGSRQSGQGGFQQ